MATDNNSESFTAEQLSVIADYEKTGPENVQEHYDMLLDPDIAIPQLLSSTVSGIALQKHRRKSSRPVQYRPGESLSTAKAPQRTELNNDSSLFESVLPDNSSAPNLNGMSAEYQIEEGQPSDGVMESIQAALDLRGIEDINQRITSQLQKATEVADGDHQPCPFCSYVFSSVVFLVRHLKYRHGINLEMQVSVPQDPSSVPLDPSLDQTNSAQSLGSSDSPDAGVVGSKSPIAKEQNVHDAKQTVDPDQVDELPEEYSDKISLVDKEELKKGQKPSTEMTNQDQFAGPGGLLNQVTEQPVKPILVCNQCTRAFLTEDDLEKHQQIHNIEKSFQCQHCEKLFQNSSSLKKHTKLHTDGKVYTCEVCDKSFAATAYLKTHMRLHTKQKPFVCKHCGKAFAASGTLISHERIHINDKPYGCEFCGKRFRQGSHLNRHKIIHTNMKPHICRKCDRAFADVANLRRHERIHNQDNPNVCGECGKTFINLSSLKKHERLHTNEKPYICRHCSKPFASSGNLISHERTHTNERPYICKECGKAFTQSSHLKAHLGTHSTDTLYVCKHCGRGFTQRSTLCVHERIHLNKKPYICKFCTRAFTQSSTLKAHIRTHTKERAHVCKVCGKAFSARGNLKSHELIHTNEKPFKCKACPKAFKQGSTLRAHERTHTKERPYVCRECGKAFADGSNLKAHLIRIHNRDASLSLSMLYGAENLDSLIAESGNETLPPDEEGSPVTENLVTQEQCLESPVGITIKKTKKGLASALRTNVQIPQRNHESHETTKQNLSLPIDKTQTILSLEKALIGNSDNSMKALAEREHHHLSFNQRNHDQEQLHSVSSISDLSEQQDKPKEFAKQNLSSSAL
ncbi:uncharacterized protein [Asterias amurensis]|uniref:uncharacterized protein n=1 Tax=Asterias amurensis TaxID=7602 RepID=UPI003AB1ED7E